VLSSILIQGIIQLAGQIGIYLLMRMQSWYTPIIGPIPDADVNPSPENTAIFLVANFQYIITAICFSISRPFKKPIYSNFVLTGFLIVVIAYSYYIIIRPDWWNAELLILVDFDDASFKFVILVMTLVNFIVSYLCEKLIVPCVSEGWKNRSIRQFKSQQSKLENANLNQLYKIKINQ